MHPPRLLALATLLATAAAAFAQSEEAPPALTAQTYSAIRRHVDLRPEDLAWQAVDWKTGFFDGLVEAQRQDKPIFLWFYFGDPRALC